VSGIARISAFDPSPLEVQIAAEVKDFDPKNYMDFKASRRMDRYSQLAVAASGEAIKDASLSLDGDNTYRVGVMMNTGGGGIQTLTREVQVYYNKGANRVSPFFIPMFAPN